MRLNVECKGIHEERLKDVVEEYGVSQADLVRKMISEVYFLNRNIQRVKKEMERIKIDERYEESLVLIEQYARYEGRLRQMEELKQFIMMWGDICGV